MEHYCINCDGFFKDAKFDHDYGRCNKCSKHERKRKRKRQAIFQEYEDIQTGDMMLWCGRMCVVTDLLPNRGWAVFIPSLGQTHKVWVWADDNLESFNRRLCRYRPPSETDKK